MVVTGDQKSDRNSASERIKNSLINLLVYRQGKLDVKRRPENLSVERKVYNGARPKNACHPKGPEAPCDRRVNN